jgi:hypothetical protein
VPAGIQWKKAAVAGADANHLRAAVGVLGFLRRHFIGWKSRLLRRRLTGTTEKLFEKTPLARLDRHLHAAPAIGIIAGEQILALTGRAAALQLPEIGLHLLDARVESRALRRRGIAEKQKLLPVAAERARIADSSIDFDPLLLGCAGKTIGAAAAGLIERR